MYHKLNNVNTSIVGLGRIAHTYYDDYLIRKNQKYPTHLSVLKNHNNFKLISACDTSKVQRLRFKRKVDVPVFSNIETMLKKTAPKLLVVSTPPEYHKKCIISAIKNGVKAIFCEKPICLKLDDAKEIFCHYYGSNILFFVNYFRLFNKTYNHILNKYLINRKMGDVICVNAKYSNGILNNGTHIISFLSKFLKHPISSVGFVSSVKKLDYTVDAVVKFENNVYLHLCGVRNDFINIFEIDIFLQNGRILIQNDKFYIYNKKKSQKISNFYEFVVKSEIDSNIGHSLYDAYENIKDCLISNKCIPMCSIEDSIETLRITESIIKSATEKKEVFL